MMYNKPHAAMRAQVMDFLGAAAFSKAVQALDIQAGRLVCLKIIKNNKDYFDQSLDEIKLLNYVNAADPLDEHGMLRLYDYFYYKARLCPRSCMRCSRRGCWVLSRGMARYAGPPHQGLRGIASVCHKAKSLLQVVHVGVRGPSACADMRRSTCSWCASCCAPTCTSSRSTTARPATRCTSRCRACRPSRGRCAHPSAATLARVQ